MKQEFTYNQMVHLNAELREKGIPYRLNFKDEKMAGIQELGICAATGKESLMREAVAEYFARQGMTVEFSLGDLEITIGKQQRKEA